MDKVVKYFPLLLVTLLSLRSIALGITISDALVCISLVGLMSLRELLEKHKKMREVEEATKAKLDEMKNAINAQNVFIKAQAEEFDKLRNSMTGIKLQFGQTTTPGVRKQA